MSNIDELYKEWSGVHHTVNSCKLIHDSAEVCDFAEYYYKNKKMDHKSQMLLAKFFAERRRMNDNDLDLLYMLDDIYKDNYKRTRDRVEACLAVIGYVCEME